MGKKILIELDWFTRWEAIDFHMELVEEFRRHRFITTFEEVLRQAIIHARPIWPAVEPEHVSASHYRMKLSGGFSGFALVHSEVKRAFDWRSGLELTYGEKAGRMVMPQSLHSWGFKAKTDEGIRSFRWDRVLNAVALSSRVGLPSKPHRLIVKPRLGFLGEHRPSIQLELTED